MNGGRSFAAAAAATLIGAVAAGCGGGFSTSAPEESPQARTFTNYVALGDGFASAPYLGPDESGTGCRRSADNYPNQVAQALQVATLTDVSCAGATTENLTSVGNPPDSSKPLAPQLDAVTPETDLVTIGIGLEDNGLLRTMFSICENEPCGDDVLAPTVVKQVDAFGSAIVSAVRTIQDVAPAATIVVVGYPQLMPSIGRCAALPEGTETQLSYAFKIFGQLNDFLRAAAFQTGASFIDVAALSADHHACSEDPWVSGAKATPGKVQALHPLAVEQDAVAQAIIDQVRILS